MNKFPIGVIGVGHLGSLHAKMLSGISSAELIGVSDADMPRAQSVAADAGTEAFASLDELLVRVKAVTVATPTSTHFAIASKAIERGIHTFIEKPITSTV